MLGQKETKVLDLISEDLDYSHYFFRKAKDLKWFYPLKEKGYFNPTNIQFTKEGQSYFWAVLDYLERVSEQVVENEKYGKELLAIISNVIQYSQQTRKINNYHIWWYCIKILDNIPSPLITSNIDNTTFKTWLQEWTNPSFGSNLTISDISSKLLKKFLSDNNTIPFAETIIEAITRIQLSVKKGASDKKEDATLVWSDFWILDTFKNHVKNIGEKCSSNIIYYIADKLKRSLEFKQKDTYVNISENKNFYRLKILRLVKKGLKEKEIAFKESSYECIIKQFTPDQLEKTDKETIFWALHKINPKKNIKKFHIKANSKKLFIKNVKKGFLSQVKCNKKVDLDKKISQLYDGLFEDYSQVWFKSMKDGGSDHASGTEEVLTILLRDVILAKCASKKSEGKLIVKNILSNKFRFPVFKKIGLLCIDKYWVNYAPLFKEFVKNENNILNKADWEIELQDLLRVHNKDFNKALIRKLTSLIEDVPEYYQKEGKVHEAYWKYKWLSPLKDNPAFIGAYENAKKEAQIKEDKPYEPERSAFKSGWISHQSPLTKKEILVMPLNELIQFFNEFKGTDSWGGTFEGEPDKEGLADTLQAAVKEDPSKFNNEIELFYAAPYGYVHKMLWGLRDAWRDGKELSWGKLFDFCIKYVSRDNFIQEALQAQGSDSGEGKYLWVVDSIVELIEDGSRKDEKSFDKKYFPIVDSIFDALIPLLKGEKEPRIQRDAVTYALNTTLGRVIESFIIYSLRVARVNRANGKAQEKYWGKNKYDRFFNKGIDAYIWLGRYLPNIKFLDIEFVKQKIKEITARETADIEWQNFMEAYLTGPYVYEDLYSLMKKNYLKAIDSKVFEKRAENGLAHHIALGYLRGYELLNKQNKDGSDSLFWKILTQTDSEEKKQRWFDIVSFFWSISGRTRRNSKEKRVLPEDREKILKFWEFTVKKQVFVREKLGEKYPLFLGQIGELAILLDTINENNFEWLMLSAPYVESIHHSSFFIEYLAKFEDEKSLQYIGKVFLKMLENSTPTFRSEYIQTIVEKLYKLGEKYAEAHVNADAICNTYGKRGSHFLKDIYYAHQKNK